MPLGTLKLHPKGRHYRIFLNFRLHWALLACLRWSLGTLGVPWVPLDGSICHLWGSMGAPLARPWAPFVAFGAPFWRLWLSLGVTLEALRDRLLQKAQLRHCGLNCNRILKTRFCTCAQTQTCNTHLRTNPGVQRAQHAHAHRPMEPMGRAMRATRTCTQTQTRKTHRHTNRQ